MIDVEVLASAKQVIDQPLSGGGGSNRYCADFVSQAEDNGENAQSVGILARFGEFRVLHLGDMTVNTEFQLMCSDNPIGTSIYSSSPIMDSRRRCGCSTPLRVSKIFGSFTSLN